MASNIRFRDLTKTAMLNQLKAAIDAGGAAGTLKIYSGTAPATPETAPAGGNVLLGTLTLSYNPCASITGSNATHKLTFGAITQDAMADNNGVAAWARISDSAGNAIVDLDASVTGGTGGIQLNTLNIVKDGPIQVTLCTIALP